MTPSREIPKEGICSLCGGHYDDYGHNPAPLGTVGARCCTLCNSQLVIPVRLRHLANDRTQGEGAR